MIKYHGWKGNDPSNMLIIPTGLVISIAADKDTTVFVTSSGELFIGHYNEDEKGSLTQIEIGSRIATDAAIYKSNIVFSTKNGEVFSYSIQNDSITQVHILEPKKTCSHGNEENGKRVFIEKIHAGIDHIVYLSNEKELWIQGKGAALGLFTNKNENEISNPTRLDFFNGRKVLQVETGDHFTLALVESLSSSAQSISSKNLSVDFDSFVTTCDVCRKETGDRILFQGLDNQIKCPLGIGVSKEDISISDSSILEESCSEKLSDDHCSNANSNSPSVNLCTSSDAYEKGNCNSGIEMVHINRRSESIGSDFEVLESSTNLSDKEADNSTLSISKDIAKKMLSKPMSWVSSSTLSSGYIGIESEKLFSRYPIDSAAEILRENVVSAASMVANSVLTVGNKMDQFSQQFTSTETEDEVLQNSETDLSSSIINEHLTNKVYNYDSHEWDSFLSTSLHTNVKKTHMRTSSTGNYTVHTLKKNAKSFSFYKEDNVESIKTKLIENGKDIANYEVWSWGLSDKGELGQGDQCQRSLPSKINCLSQLFVVKITCGRYHSVALTVDGQVFWWGTMGDCLNSNAMSSSPFQIQIPNGERAKDIGAGDDFIIVISLTGKIYYIDGWSQNKEIPKFKQLHLSDGTSLAHSVMCRSETVLCTEGSSHPKVQSFMKAELEYMSNLKKTVKFLISPILDHQNYENKSELLCPIDVGSIDLGGNELNISAKVKASKFILLRAFEDLTHATAGLLTESWMSQLQEITQAVSIIHHVQVLLHIYKEFVQTACNTISMGGLSLLNKETEIFLPKLLNIFPDNDKSNSLAITKLFLMPFKRVQEYTAFLNEVKNDTSTFYSPFSFDKIKFSFTLWKDLQFEAFKDKASAEETQKFWNSLPKLFESLASPSCRIIKDSRKTPINIQNASRFSSNYFYLLSDAFVHFSFNNFAVFDLRCLWVEPLPQQIKNQNAIQLTAPEESLVLVCPTALDKSQWLQSLQDSIKKITDRSCESSLIALRSPSLVRHSTYTFAKHPVYKDATYTGQWFCGKMQHDGCLIWPSGKKYIGQFRGNEFQGFGKLEVPYGSNKFDVYEGIWRKGKLEGKGVIRYGNGDIYMGFLHESLPHGHGELKKGCLSSDVASIYTGEWYLGVKHGYGVLDEIAKGEKYHGMWQNNLRHGPGMVVTMNDVYYEGNFNQNKLHGFGVLILDDGTVYEGEMGSGGVCNGKGKLRFFNGDFIEGCFNGSMNESIKINGNLQKANHSIDKKERFLPSSFGKMTVPASEKWKSLFSHFEQELQVSFPANAQSASKVWLNLAAHIETEKQILVRRNRTTEPLDGLDKIIDGATELTHQNLQIIQEYLKKAFSSYFVHPLGQMLQLFVNAFRATYGGVVVHPLLLEFAIKEIWSCTSRLYRVVNALFPCLPSDGQICVLESEEEELVVTPAFMIHPWLLPHLYASVSPLYVRHHQKDDEEYWQRLLKWNKQSDISLMTFLGVDIKFWLGSGENLTDKNQVISNAKDHHFLEAVDALQLLSTSFTPKDKLLLIRKCGASINKEASSRAGPNHVICMDDFLPLFLYVVVRSRIQHLGAQICFIDDLSDPHFQNGELNHIFTTLKACYHHILHEKPSNNAHYL